MAIAFRPIGARAFGIVRAATAAFPLKADPCADDAYRLSYWRTIAHRFVSALPPYWREPFAQAFLRRRAAPGPAAEHVVQYLLSDAFAKVTPGAAREATVAKGADNFYSRQYRQYLNPTMGAFAMTAKMAALSAGAAPRRTSWARRRRVALAMAQTQGAAPPILVLDHQTVATPLFLPKPQDDKGRRALTRWLAGRGPMPPCCRKLVEGDEMRCAERGARATRRSGLGAMLEVSGAALQSRKLAILALHPHDPDAMGMHITLFGVEALAAEEMERDYALETDALAVWRCAAEQMNATPYFLVGGVDEAFTQCSQNLFVKRPRFDGSARAAWPKAWTPGLPLDRLLTAQFEILQATVSSAGLPGVSPRNGDVGKAGFVARRDGRTLVLIPYFVGNAVHGHAAKLWSNPYSSILIWDDHSARCAVTISGAARVVAHEAVVQEYSDIAEQIAERRRRNGLPADDPEYWFEQEASEIIMQDEPIAANWLDPARSTCSISAAGQALHGKKPAYFVAESLPPYDMAWQHEREAEGRPKDPTGVARREWESAPALESRRAHLERFGA